MKKEALRAFIKRNFVSAEDVERASKILAALDGMSIFEAQEFLDLCKGALMCEQVSVTGYTAESD